MQLLLDASVTLMNQYASITSRLPPLNEPTVSETSSAYAAPPCSCMLKASEQQQPSTSGITSSNVIASSSPNTDNDSKPSSSSAISVTASSSSTSGVVKIEDLGDEAHLDRNTPQTSNESTQESDGNVITDQSELRRRRLEKLLS